MTGDREPLPARVRAGVAAVASRAELVRIDEAALDRFAASMDPSPPEPFPEQRWTGSPEDRVVGVVAWNAVNFGSGWSPPRREAAGHSGARTLAGALVDDELVPHVLKVAGVLVVDPALDASIAREELLVSGKRGEVELRALAIHAVELLVDRLRSAGHDHVTAATGDHRLWQQGQDRP